MAAKKKKKSKKPARAAKAKKSAAKKTIKAARKKTKKSSAAKAPQKAQPKKSAKRSGKAKQMIGEGDYQASRRFLKDQSSFVEKNRSKIDSMGKAAESALEGPEGDALRDAEAAAAAHARDTI